MGKDNKKKDYSNPDAFQEDVKVDPKLGGDGENPPAPQGNPGDDAAASAKKLKAAIAITPNAQVDVQMGKTVGSVSSGNSFAPRIGAGFGSRSVVDDASKIPYQSESKRPTTPYGKKSLGETSELDSTCSEMITPKVEDAEGLTERSSADQVYNGRKQFTKVRGKKNFKGGPQNLLYDASVDMDISSFILHTTGQVVGNVEKASDYPSIDIKDLKIAEKDMMHKSNYLMEGFSFSLKNGRLDAISFDEVKLPVTADYPTRDEANLNWQVDRNNVAQTMRRLQGKYGNETDREWSPLGYTISQAYEHNMLLHDVEATTGAIAATAYRAAVSSLAFQRNIINKDGAKPYAAALRMFLENYAGSLPDGQIADKQGGIKREVFNRQAYLAGSAAAMIEMFDSVSKYTSKGDILNGQRSLSMHLGSAANNIKPLHVKPDFMKVLDKAHMFSTVDGQYSPMLPIYCTRKIRLMNPLSLNFFLKDWKHPDTADAADAKDSSFDPRTGLKAVYGYKYSDQRNKYVTRIQHPIVAGLVRWMLQHEAKLAKVYGDTATVHLSTDFDFMYPGMFQLMLCAAMSSIIEERKDPLRDILFNDHEEDYVWQDLESLAQNDPLKSSQMKINGYGDVLEIGTLADDTKIRLMWGTNYTMINKDGNNSVSYVMPWFMSESAFSGSPSADGYDGFRNPDNPYQMNIPSIRLGVQHSYVELVKGKSASEVRLSLDRPLDIPRFTKLVSGSLYDTVALDDDNFADEIKHVSLSSMRYDTNSEGRLVVTYDNDRSAIIPGVFKYLSEYSTLTIPKELGWIWNGLPSMIPVVSSVEISDKEDDKNKPAKITLVTGSISKRADTFTRNMCGGTAREIRSYRVKDDAFTDGTIDRASATWQAYRTAYANAYVADTNVLYTDFTGVALSMSYGNVGMEDLACQYALNSGNLVSNPIKVQSNARMIWSLLQRFFLPINPFDNCYDNPTSRTSSMKMFDPLESSYFFGLCGMLATDYNQAVLARLNAFDQLDLSYTEDVFSKASLLLQ